MKPTFRVLCLAALLLAGVTLAGCAGTRDNAQQADAADRPSTHGANMTTPF
jgi:hypothetical protein